MSEKRIPSVTGILRRQAEVRPDSVAVLSPDGPELSYADLWRRVGAIAGAINGMGLRGGDRVAIVLPNGPDAALAFLGVSAAATAAPLNPAYRVSEFEFFLSDLGAKALVAAEGDHACRESARALGVPVLEWSDLARSLTFAGPIERTSSDEAVVLHTSGTTSRPKLVSLTHANLLQSAYNVAETLGLGPQDRVLNVMPLFHIHGLVAALLASLTAGGSIVATGGMDSNRFFDWMGTFRPTWYTAVPTMHQAVLAAARAAGSTAVETTLRLIRSSSSALAPAVMSELENAFGVPVIEAYGMTEAAHQMASNPLPPRARRPGSVGLAAGPEIAIMDASGGLMGSGNQGEVVIRGVNVTAGYDKNDDANRKAFTNGWFRTGDQGYLDENGYLFLTGRLKEIINRGGEKISPKEIDECLLEHPSVAQAIAFAMPHTTLGQDVAAAVVLRDGEKAASSELRQFAATRLAPFKVPNRIVIVKEIPKGPTGKLQRIGLAEKLGLLGRDATCAKPAAPYAAPRTPLEENLVQIWSGMLGFHDGRKVGVHDDFNQLGGDSLMAATLLAQVGAAFNVDAEVLIFDEFPTVAAMAERLQGQGTH